MHKILISDKFDPEGVARLKEAAGMEVIYKGGHNREELLESISQAHGLIIRSSSRVDAELLSRATHLKAVLRAGVGVDNIDIPECSRRGIIVMNAPGGNSVSTAEHAISLLMALARNIPQAHSSMKAGKWEKSKFSGIELTGKTLGVVGLGRIGKEVVKRARALKMNVIGFDPFIPAANLSSLEIDIVEKEQLLRESDFITVHTPLTDATKDFINKNNFSLLKKGVRLVNCARGGIYNENDLLPGLESGVIGGVALDVFSTEPVPADFPLRDHQAVIMTPHLGASTTDAEFAVAMETVDETIEFFQRGIARNSLNFPTLDPESLDFLKPFYDGGTRIGKLMSLALRGEVKEIQIIYYGEVAEYMTDPVSAAIIQGALEISCGDEVNFVNAPFLARERSIQITEEKDAESVDFSRAVRVRMTSSQGQLIQLTFTSIQKEPRVISLFGLPLEFKPEGILLLVENQDVPGVVGSIGSYLGRVQVNIASIELARESAGKKAHCVIAIDELLTADQLADFGKIDHILRVEQIDLR
ncbi:MAG: phosphoglycerate dehydrogenase [Spirochaetales bacterium]|nr:phosphoglycerate dehydrogenase [Spirochaetales bacterium]